MSCISLPKVEPESADPGNGGIRWNSIVRGIRIHAVQQPHDIALDLLEWADFLEGLCEIETRGERG